MPRDLHIGEVIELPVGLHCYHNQGVENTVIQIPVVCVIENTRRLLPFSNTGAESHFEECYMVKCRALNTDGSYFPEGALLTVAVRGDFRPEFLLPETTPVLRRMAMTFLPVAAE